ncbi:DUF5615 family PIN-like protein [candidate division WOR-3 bacterium]|nr:DUF5615 family PIN-like protein [candidate division WOR-3 bacterium]
MEFLIDEDLPRSVGNLLRRAGHEAIDVRDIGLRGAPDSEIASYAQSHNLCLLTGDTGFADIRNYPPKEYSGIIVIYTPREATAKYILEIIEGFLKQEQLISELSGKLTIIEPGRIRIR